ncbi:APC family permease [Kitasatospora acidiphila]|uniref:APC family permease n=1 Tax=Kitasatospora acidiphila TaxID=2567942 RepID=A0A540W5X8_9ACTN|nr:APC family permease [Kitasatospora acidiphila]TQF03764.1 APC family permease [Kitasatospora acidiphila]
MSAGTGARTPEGGTVEGGVDRLKANSVGLVGVVFMSVATAAPITSMTGNLPIIVGSGSGVGAPAAYIFATVVLTVFSVGYVAMARHITAAGAFYGFISHGLGRVVGMASGLLAVLAYIVFEASIIGFFSYSLQGLVASQLGLHLAWGWYAILGLLAIGGMAFFDIHLTAKVLGVALVLEIAVLAAVSAAVAVSGGGPDGIPLAAVNPVNAFHGVNGGGTAAAGLGLFFAFWSWVGFESTAMYGEESRDPKRVVPRATLIAVIGVGVFYVFVSWMIISANGVDNAIHIAAGLVPGKDGNNLFFDPLGSHFGAWAVNVFQWLVVTSSFACAMAFHQCAARYLYAIGREGFIHRALGRTHPRHGSPFVASAVQSVIALALVTAFLVTGKDPYVHLYSLLALLGTMAILIVQTLCSFAVVGYFHVQGRHPETRHWLRTLVAPLVGGVAMAGVVTLLVLNLGTAAGPAASTLLFKLIPYLVIGTFLGGIGLAVYMKRRSPERYARMGRIILEDSAERATDQPVPTGS